MRSRSRSLGSRVAAASLVLLTASACEKDEARARWRYSCGDPVCVGYTVKPGVALCTSQVAGGSCGTPGVTCDPRDDCNRLLVCSAEEPGLVTCPDVP